jgi:hypothetical protein
MAFKNHDSILLEIQHPHQNWNWLSLFRDIIAVYAGSQMININRVGCQNTKLIQINQSTRCNNLSSLFLEVYVQLNMFWSSSRPSSGALQLQQQQPLVLPLERGGSSAVGRVRAGRTDHDQQHCYHHAPTVKTRGSCCYNC